MKKGKLITIGGAIVVLALCGYFFMGTSSKGKISFQTEKVTRNSMTDVVVPAGRMDRPFQVLPPCGCDGAQNPGEDHRPYLCRLQ